MVASGSVHSSASSQVKPRHVLCLLGGEGGKARLTDAMSGAIAEFATGFSVDETYSQAGADPRMERSFGVCWDRVEPNAWTAKDEEAVLNHKSVLYVLGPPMTADTTVRISAASLMLVHAAIKAGAVAIKGESAGIAHGLVRWQQLIAHASAALQSDDDVALRRICRLAFAKRPVSAEKYLESVGFIWPACPKSMSQMDTAPSARLSLIMDSVADDLGQRKLDTVLGERKAGLSHIGLLRNFEPFSL